MIEELRIWIRRATSVYPCADRGGCLHKVIFTYESDISIDYCLATDLYASNPKWPQKSVNKFDMVCSVSALFIAKWAEELTHDPSEIKSVSVVLSSSNSDD